MCFQQAAWRLAVSVITPSRSRRTASYLSRMITRLLLGCRIERSPVTKGHPFPLIQSSRRPAHRALADERPVPDPHSRYRAIVAEDTQGTRIQQKMLAAARRQLDPARREHAQHMSVREWRDVVVDRARPGDHPVDTRTHLFRRLTARASIPEDQPIRRNLTDLLGRQSLELAVVPLDQVGVDHCFIAEAGQLAGLSCPLHRTAENELKPIPGEYRPHPLRKPAAVVGQRNVRRPCVLPGKAPRRLPVPDREHIHVRLRRGQTLSASVERTPAEAASCPHLQPVISGISSPYRQMNSLWSMSLSRIACLAGGGGAPSFGTRSITSLTRWKRSRSFSTHMSNG